MEVERPLEENKQHQKELFYKALQLIESRYSDVIQNNDNYKVLKQIEHGDERLFFDVVRFLGQEAFTQVSNMASLNVAQGCTVAGFTSIKPEGQFFQFYDSKAKELRCRSRIQLNTNVMSQSTIIHELLHFLTHPNFSKEASPDLTEGVTEYFTRKVQNQVFNYIEEKHSNEPVEEGASTHQRGGRRNFNFGQDEMKSLNEMKGFTNNRSATSAYNIAHDKTIASKGVIRTMLSDTNSYKPEGMFNKITKSNPQKKELKKNLGKLDKLDSELKSLLASPDVSTKHILKRAYFLGDLAMIRLLVHYSNVTFK